MALAEPAVNRFPTEDAGLSKTDDGGPPFFFMPPPRALDE
jgi:hypothetical protein